MRYILSIIILVFVGYTYSKGGKLIKYKVAKGDNLTKISKKFKVSIGDILRVNKLKNPNMIKRGDVILIPKKSRKKVSKKRIRVKFFSPVSKKNIKGIRCDRDIFILKIYLKKKTVVYGISSGRVLSIGSFRDINKIVVVKGRNGYTYGIANLKRVYVKTGALLNNKRRRIGVADEFILLDVADKKGDKVDPCLLKRVLF